MTFFSYTHSDKYRQHIITATVRCEVFQHEQVFRTDKVTLYGFLFV